MLTRSQMHFLIDELPEPELHVLSRVLEGLKATTPVHAHATPAVPGMGQIPLAREYSQVMRHEESPESSNLLRKVMFTPLSELLTWINQPVESGPK